MLSVFLTELCDRVLTRDKGMAARKNVRVTESQRKKYFRELMSGVKCGEIVHDEHALDILKHHPQWSTKTRGGKLSIVKRQHGSDFTLRVVDEQGHDVDDISWVIAVKGELGLKTDVRDSQLFKVTKAARELVRGQIVSFRQLTGVPSHYEVDHANVDFAQMLRRWLQLEELQFSNVQIKWPPRGVPEFVDQNLALRWQQYHKQEATLQALSPTEHKEVTKKRRWENRSNTYQGRRGKQ